ncbi:MAG: hypothetical protein ACRDK7_13765 [Solirubrobacteraceae bacterium]
MSGAAPTPPKAAPEGSPAVRASLGRLRALLLDEGGLMAMLVDPQADLGVDPRAGSSSGPQISAGADPQAGPAQLAAAGPRAEGRREDYELLIEAIYEGYLLHYGEARVARTSDRDLGLLAGDRLYALGLARLVALGDLAAVVELADTITLSALAEGADAPELADAVWAAGARAIGWGSGEAHRRAKNLVLAGSPDAVEAMRTSAIGLATPR